MAATLAALVGEFKLVKAKKRCCKSKPRCKKCPVVWKKLAEQGYAEPAGKLRYVVVDVVPKRAFKSARG